MRNQHRDYAPGEQISLPAKINSELLSAIHVIARREGLSTAQWVDDQLRPIAVKSIGVPNPAAALAPGGGFPTKIDEIEARFFPDDVKPARGMTKVELIAELEKTRADNAEKARALAALKAPAAGARRRRR